MKKTTAFLTFLTTVLLLGTNFPGKAQCPDWNTCIDLFSSDGCTHAFIISIKGDAVFSAPDPNQYFIDALQLTYSLSGDGIIISASFWDQNGELANKGTLTFDQNRVLYRFFSTTTQMDCSLIIGDQIVVVVEGEGDPASCFTMSRTGINSCFQFPPGNGACSVTGICNPTTICGDGVYIGGLVTGYTNTLTPCENTPLLNIVGAELSITGTNGSCTDVTSTDASYGCYICEGGPYEVCVTTTCPDPCGLDEFDIMAMQELILGLPGTSRTSEHYFIGDVDGDGRVTVLDIIEVRKVLEGLESRITNWCRFVPVVDFFAFNPGIDDLSAIDNCLVMDSPLTNANFYRFMRGDFDGDCDDCIHRDGVGPILFAKNDSDLSSRIYHSVSEKIFAYTITLDIADAAAIDYVSSPLPEYSYVFKEEDQLQFIWFDASSELSGFMVNPEEPLLSIHYKESGISSPQITPSAGNYILTAERGTFEITDWEENGYRRKVKSEINFQIRHNKTIELNQGQEEVHITLYDMMGRKVVEIENFLISNRLDCKEYVTTPGIYVAKIENKYNDITAKVLIR